MGCGRDVKQQNVVHMSVGVEGRLTGEVLATVEGIPL